MDRSISTACFAKMSVQTTISGHFVTCLTAVSLLDFANFFRCFFCLLQHQLHSPVLQPRSQVSSSVATSRWHTHKHDSRPPWLAAKKVVTPLAHIKLHWSVRKAQVWTICLELLDDSEMTRSQSYCLLIMSSTPHQYSTTPRHNAWLNSLWWPWSVQYIVVYFKLFKSI